MPIEDGSLADVYKHAFSLFNMLQRGVLATGPIARHNPLILTRIMHDGEELRDGCGEETSDLRSKSAFKRIAIWISPAQHTPP